ncbi:hypothetical protein [Actinomadura sp. SCN-SB]|uniref:hypothetical protein n=1 Tax=Actinomadura sp. SCN-SB TaxID=3373092 RepID=UPI0037523F18
MRDPTIPATAPAATAADPGTIAEASHGPIIKMLRQQYDVLAWYGPFTGHWWAMVGPARLVEAEQPAELEHAIRRAWGWER